MQELIYDALWEAFDEDVDMVLLAVDFSFRKKDTETVNLLNKLLVDVKERGLI